MSLPKLHREGRYIKDDFGNTVVFKGVNKVEFADDPDGTWMGSTMWRDENVAEELDAMKSWGINVIRCHISVELWKYDIGPDSGHLASPYCAISTREAIKRLLTMAAERGIYVIIDGYSVGCYWTGGDQDPLPFPPYQISTNASAIIGSVDDFVEWWRSVANELKGYPNVMFDLWNEPNPPMEAWGTWLDAAQRGINAIRETGFDGIILFGWRTGVYCNAYEDHYSSDFTLHTWLEDAIASLNDPTGNLVYDCHFYRIGGSTGMYKTADMQEKWGSNFAWDYEQIKAAMEWMGWKWAGETLNVPILMGEGGATLGWGQSNPVEHQHEMTAWSNLLQILDEWGIHYVAFWWRNSGVYRLLQHGESWVPPPTESGQILIDAIAGLPPPPEFVTPWSSELEEGTYRITMPSEVDFEGKTYRFLQWEDGTTDPERTVNLIETKTITATYQLITTVIISGSVINAETSEPIMGATVKAGDYQTTTLTDGTFSLPIPPGTYTVTISKTGYKDTEIPDLDATSDVTFPEPIMLTPSPVPEIPWLEIGLFGLVALIIARG